MNKPTIKDFKRARIEFDDTVEDVAEKFDYSRSYIYQVLKYPNMNSDLHKKITEYVNDSKRSGILDETED